MTVRRFLSVLLLCALFCIVACVQARAQERGSRSVIAHEVGEERVAGGVGM